MPALMGKTFRVAGRRPELFRDVRGEWREQDEQGLNRLTDRRKICFCFQVFGVDLIEAVHELHQRRDGCVELELLLDIVSDLFDGFMREPSEVASHRAGGDDVVAIRLLEQRGQVVH